MSLGSPIISENLALGHEILIHIQVVKSGAAYALQIYPQREDDTTVFHTRPGNNETTVRPRGVRWVVHGLKAGQSVEIGAKHPGSGHFPQDTFTIAHPDNSVHSGDTQDGPTKPSHFKWTYGVDLYDPSSVKPVASIDPVIIIKDDP